MPRLKVALIFVQTPNFSEDAFRYFILSLNNAQKTYEFFFPDLKNGSASFVSGSPAKRLRSFVQSKKVVADLVIGIITQSLPEGYFFDMEGEEENIGIITTVDWEKAFSPPSLFEYLAHSIYCCLIYSSKTASRTPGNEMADSIEINSHEETIGCFGDFDRRKMDDRIDIMTGYICDGHKEQIKTIFGEEYLNETMEVLSRKWIGNKEEKGSVAYNLKYVYKFDIDRDSGFNKTVWDKIKGRFYDIPGDVTGDVFKIFVGALITYFLVRIGILPK